MVYRNPSAGVKIRENGLQDLNLPAVSAVLITAASIAGCSSPSLPALPALAGSCAPALGAGVSTRMEARGPWGHRSCFSCLGQLTFRHGVKLPKERREEDRKNNHKNLFHAAWIPPRMQQCFWTANL